MDGIVELLPLLGRPELEVRVRAAEALAGRLGSTAAARAALLRAAGADLDMPMHEPSGLSGPPLALEPTFRMAAEEEPLPMTKLGGDGTEMVADGRAHRPPPLIVPTEHAERVLRQLSLALCLARPVLLSGPPGAGKTTLLRALAASAPRGGSSGGGSSGSASTTSAGSQLDGLVTVHLDEQVDSRALLGSYVCGAEPGEFVWQPGVVTQAVAQGRWLLLEDVDRAPLEVMSALAPLLERNVLFVPGRAATLAAAPGFRLWGTVTTHGRAEVAAVERSVFRAAIWQHVSVPPPSDRDLTVIVAARFPPLRAAAGALVAAFMQLQHASGGAGAAAHAGAGGAAAVGAGGGDALSGASAEATPAVAAGAGAPSLALAAEKALSSARMALSGGRVFSSRELFRWCRRLAAALALTGAMLPPPDQPGRFSSYFRELLVAEALDTFVAAVRRAGPRAELASLIAAQWQLPTERLRHMLDLRRPEIEVTATGATIGRVGLSLDVAGGAGPGSGRGGGRFALTRHALVTLERVAAGVSLSEPLLLVGETGTGKTTAVQHLAAVLGKVLLVHNLNQQSDSSELVGGFRPVQPRHIFAPLASRFERLFCRSFSRSKNGPFLAKLARRLAKAEWAKLLALVLGACASYAKLRTAAGGQGCAGASVGGEGQGAEGGAVGGAAAGAAVAAVEAADLGLDGEWEAMGIEAARLRQRLQRGSGGGDGLAFAFVEGSLVQALREGHWLLLDEVNLASPETLERVAGLLEEGGSVALTEKGEAAMVPRHPGFRLFAAMNPPTDFGKKELPAGIRSRLTELYVPALTSTEDLALVVLQYLSPVLPSPPVGAVVALYQAATQAAATRLLDGADQRPEYSLRTLCRALSYVAHALPLGYGLPRALYDGFHMTFVAQLQARFQPEAEAMLLKHLIPARPGKPLRAPPPVPPARPSGEHWIEVGGFWLATDPRRAPVPDDPAFIVTSTIEARLMHLARMVAARRYPILLQGPTSAGKTSMVERLAKRTGHRLVRINNHEHTDVQEYIGSFAPDVHGRLAFHDGALAQAVRHGYWIVLDELNLAQSEVLEALNRLLDDNRELHIPETGETLSPHPSFMLFATQNPPGAYGGRKVLSRAFRNRFLEMHMDEIPETELATILERRSALPGSFCRAMVAVMQELQRRRSSSRVFAGRAGFITPRDLFRWADRRPLTYQGLAEAGYALLAERLRAPAERETVAQVLCARLPRVTLGTEALYERLLSSSPGGAPPLDSISPAGTVWLPSTRRLYALVAACMAANEPVLLVGETGTGKTTVCQLFAQAIGQTLHIINCHQHTETADFVGGLRPARGRSLALAELSRRVDDAEAAVAAAIRSLPASLGVATTGGKVENGSSPAPVADEADAVAALRDRAERAIRAAGGASEALGRAASEGSVPAEAAMQSEVSLGRASADLAAVVEELRSSDALFVWMDGPLLTAMRTGQMLLIDEISLAEDSVLERLNSVLDPSREITVPEKGTELEVVRAAPSFRLLATMNPGGDFGKKELSPALRNRFTEVWVPSVTAHAELRTLIGQTLGEGGTSGGDVEMHDAEAEWPMAEPMLAFVEWLAQPRAAGGGGAGLSGAAPSLRDLLAWAGFVKATRGGLGRAGAFVHGACLTCVDAMGLQVSASRSDREAVRARCVAKLISLLPACERDASALCLGSDTVPRFEPGQVPGPTDGTAGDVARRFGLAPFFVPMGIVPPTPAPISLAAPTPRANAFRVLRAMQLRKPVLLEGSPGVGKTSLVQALGAACGQPVVRINLSEQTDLMDLLGSDLPVEGAPAGTYAWQDGAFLAALRAGAWVILDELNLAPQAVLEGLNACLDHRATVFIPELAASFECPPSFRVFGCQNPLQQGGGRKGLPRSFLNRFTQVWMEELDEADMVSIGMSLFGQLGETLLRGLVGFIRALQRELSLGRFGVAGGPWDFNLRDVFRWSELLLAEQEGPHWRPSVFLDALVLQRFRSEADRQAALRVYAAAMGSATDPIARPPPLQPHYSISDSSVQIGHVWLPRARAQLPGAAPLELLPLQLRPLQALALAVRMGWMCTVCGEAGSGKSSTLRLLAGLAGRRMEEVVLSTATDTTELLGCFEQSEASRLQLAVLNEAAPLVSSLTSTLAVIGSAAAAAGGAAAEALQLAAALQQVHAELAEGGAAETRAVAGPAPSDEDDDLFEERAAALLAVLDAAAEAAGGFTSEARRCVAGVRARVACLSELRLSGSKGRFVWVDGPLLRAMEEGHWLLLDNANLCNPSVLDRLNPLFERGGVLQLPEAGLQSGGQLRQVEPHPDFRLFLAVVPSAGELSRAMRNRGIEVALLPPPSASRDVLSMLRCGVGAAASSVGPCGNAAAGVDEGGVPGTELSLAMVAAHARVELHAPRSVGHRGLLHCGELLVQKLRSGAPLHTAVLDAVELAYEARLLPEAARVMREAAESACAPGGERAVPRALELDGPILGTCPLWPVSVSTSGYATDAQLCAVRAQAALLVQLSALAATGASWPVEGPPRIELAGDGGERVGERCQPAEMLCPAAFNFVLRASERDTQMRLFLLGRLAAIHGAGAAPVLRVAGAMLERMGSLPLVLVARAAVRTSCAGDEGMSKLCEEAPIDLPWLNPPLYERLRRHAAAEMPPDPSDCEGGESGGGAALIPLPSSASVAPPPASWSQLSLVLPRLRLVLQFEWESLLETAQLDAAVATIAPQDMSLLQQSFARASRGGGKSDVAARPGSARSAVRAAWDGVVGSLYPALSDVLAMAQAWLSETQTPSEEALLRAVGAVGAARRAFACWAMRVDRGSFWPQDALVLWRALHKRIHRASQPPLGLPVPPAVLKACARISAAIGYEGARFAPLVWKWGGHPPAPPSAELMQAGLDLRLLAATLDDPARRVAFGSGAESARAAASLRLSVVVGACTLQCAYAQRHESAAEVQRLIDVPAVIRAQLDGLEERKTPGTGAARVTPPLWPLHNIRSARAEAELVAALARLSSSIAGHATEADFEPAALRTRSAAFSGMVVDLCGRSLLDAAPAQTLAWLLERLPAPRGARVAVSGTGGAATAGDVAAGLGGAVRRVPPLAGVGYQLNVVWHRHLWLGEFERPPPTEATLVSNGGPAALLLSTEALSIATRLEAAYAAPVSERAAAQHELRELAGILLSRPEGDALAAPRDWTHAVDALCQLLAPIGKDVSRDDEARLLSALASFRRTCGALLGASGGGGGPSPWAAAARATIAPLVASIVGVLACSGERAVQESLIALVEPCLSAVQDAAVAVAASLEVGSDSPAQHGARGRVWVLLGLLRLRLLLPAHAVDPAAKHLLKAELLDGRLREARVARLALVLAQEAWNGARDTTELRQAEAAQQATTSALYSARLRASARPPPPAAQFGQLHSELQQWDESLGGTDAVLELSRQLQAGAAGALTREEAWQRGSCTFLQRLDAAYHYFEDVTAPLQLSIFETKHGLRLQALCCAPTAVAAQDGRPEAVAAVRQSQAMMSALLRFPSAPAPAAAPDPWRVQLLPLLQPLPACAGLGPAARNGVGTEVAHAVAPAALASASRRASHGASRLASHTAMLALALRRLLVSVLLQGGARPGHLHALNAVVGGFVKAHVEAEAAELRQAEEQAELYRRKVREHGAAATDGQPEEAAALRELFPDFREDFDDIERRASEPRPMDMDDEVGEGDGDEREEDAPGDQPATGDGPAGRPEIAATARIPPALILRVLEYHERVFAVSAATGPLSSRDASLAPVGAAPAPTRSKRGRGGSPAGAAMDFAVDVPVPWAVAGGSTYEEAERETLQAVREAHALAARLLPSLTAAHHLPASLDVEARGASLVVASCCWQWLQGSDPARRSNELGVSACPFGGEDVAEAARLAPVLDQLLERTRQLMSEWPDHPALQLMAMLCERLQSFRAGSPLMRFVTGAEMLLKRCWEWEEGACKATSVKPLMDALAKLVLRWRKMEVDAWPRLLQRAAEAEQEAALLRVWARLFLVVNSHLWHPKSQTDGADWPGSPASHSAPYAAAEFAVEEADEAARLAHLTDFFDTFQQLLLGAEAGAFEAYLRLLRAFARQLQVEARLGVREAMGDETWRVQGYASILHNLVGYYSQFCEPLRGAVGGRRAPVEAKLKDFVKLAQWHDRNFESLKQSVERAHASLSRGVRQLRDVLQTPAATLLMGALAGTAAEAGEAAEAEAADEDVKKNGFALALGADEALAAKLLWTNGLAAAPAASGAWAAGLPPAEAAGGTPLAHVPRLPALLERMRKICVQSVFSSDAAGASARRRMQLDELRVALVMRASELRSLTDKKARMLKHKALVDLLKHLSAIGLSFASSAADPRQQSMADLFRVRALPLDLCGAACGAPAGAPACAVAPLGARWQQDWERSEKLYYRCVLKLTQLRHARKRPHDDLSSREVQKAAGFVEHGVALLLQQRGALQAAVEGCAALHARLEQLSAVVCGSDASAEPEGGDHRPEEAIDVAETTVLLPQAALAARRRLAAATQQQLVQHCFECSVLYKQLSVVAPPAQSAELNSVAAVVERAARDLQGHALPYQDPPLLGIRHRLQAERLASLAAGLGTDVRAAAARLPNDQQELAAPLLAELARAAALLGEGASGGTHPEKPIMSPDMSVPAAAATRSHAAEALAGVAAAVEEAVVHVLLAVQGLRHPAPAAPPVGEAVADAAPHSAMNDHQCVLKLLRAARAPEVDVRLGGVLAALRLLADSGPSAAQSRAAGRLAGQVLPLLGLHLASARWALHQALGHHASFVRLELVLLGTFGELFAKGFCTAQQEEGEGGGGEGGGLDDDVEGTGMGEGEGKQDVSEQLKEEGQLEGGGMEPQEEEARGESRPKGPEEEKDRAKEEEGVEMTNDFDGEMADLEQPEEGREEEEEGREEPEHGMGELDEQNQEVVDERLWDKDEDEQLQPQDDDKVEKDAEVSAGDDVTMEAKADEVEEKPKKKQKKEQEEGKAEEAAQPEEDEGKEAPEAPEEEQGEGGVKPETEYEENNHMDLKPHKEEADEADGADEMPEDAPEQMDEGMSDGGEEAEGGDGDLPGPEDPAEPSAAEEEEEQGETGQTAPINSDAEAEEEEEGKAAESAPPPDVDAEPQGDEAQDGEDEATGTERRQYDEQQVFEDAGGRSAAGEPQEQDGEAQQEDQPEPPDASLRASRAAAQPNSGEPDGGDLMQMPRGGRDEPEKSRPQRSRPQPNPYHALGDALQAFHQQLRLVQREAPPADEAGAEPPTARDEEVEPNDAPANSDFELVGTNQAFDTQVLADATHEQLEQCDAAEPPPEEAQAGAETLPEEEPGEPMEEERPDGAAEVREVEADQKQSSKRRGRQAAPDEPLAEVAADGDEASEEPWTVERDAVEGPDGAGLIGPLDESLLPAAGEREEATQPDQGVEREPAVLEEMHAELVREMSAWQLDAARVTSSEELWRRFEALTAPLAQELCEQLRLILEATVASKMQGDYRTGKRISMRKVIPYIASGYRKDKIWLRRTKPAKRQYQVMLCVDDSESMRSTGAGGLACEALALICGALSRLEVGQLAVASFAEQVRLLHPFDRPFSAEAGAHMMSRFTFAQQETDMEGLLRTVVQTLRLAREQQRGSATEQMQLCIIVSDGRRSPAWGDPSLWVRRAAEEKILLCFVIIDAAANKDSILELQSVTYPNGKLTISKWIDAFPFPYYIVLRELRALPQVLSDALRQWFELMR